MTKKIFYDLQGFDTNYFTYWEDADFSLRAKINGYKLYRCYNSKVYHSVGKTCHKKSLYTTYYYQRNRLIFGNKFLEDNKKRELFQLSKEQLNAMKEKAKIEKDEEKIKYIEKILSEFLL